MEITEAKIQMVNMVWNATYHVLSKAEDINNSPWTRVWKELRIPIEKKTFSPIKMCIKEILKNES